MATKTDRILSYLPHTFKTTPRREVPVLDRVADAFGNELLLGENSLAAILLSHWVDFADKNAAEINDLGKMAALYGLAPWRDESGESLESVEEFREHLKRYVRTFLEGTVTVQGVLRVTAEALALRIAADKPSELDRWWARNQDSVERLESLGNDAAAQLNFDHSSATGSPAFSARVTGTVDLSQGVNLQGANILRLKIDGSFEEIDLTAGLTPTELLSLEQIVKTINSPPRPPVASHDGRFLRLSSAISGPASKLEVINGPHDATLRLLGLAPRTYHGAPATAAQFKGIADLDKPIDLSNERYLRIEIDGKLLQEIDCAGDDASQTTLAHVRDTINNAFPGLNVAADDGKHLILTSPTKGIGSSISVQPPAAQNAAERILGVPSLFAAGLDAQPARAESTRDLQETIDLSERTDIRLRIDGANPVTINCAGVQPDKTERVEIVAKINKAFNAVVAIITDQSISVVSPSSGPTSEIVFEKPTGPDATFDIFGIGSLSFQGSASTAAHLVASPSLSGQGLDVRANNFLVLAVDGGSPTEIDLRLGAQNHDESTSLPLNRLAEHINKSVGAQIASSDGEKLFLASTRKGGVSKIEILPRETLRKRRFVTRAIVIDEASREVFGFVEKESQGKSPIRARLIGKPDLSQSVDLQKTHFLRLQVDEFSPIEIDCAGARPRATILAEVVSAINTALKTFGLKEDVASDDGKNLILISPSSGEKSRLVIEPPRLALDKVLGVEPGTFRGAVPTAVKFTSTVNLSEGIDLPPGAAVKLAIDDAEPLEIALAGTEIVHRSPFDIANAINTEFKAPVARTDGRRVSLSSAKTGANSKIKFLSPSAKDVTKEVFGIVAPREYHGAEATPARVVGARDLGGSTDLSVFRLLRVAIDAAPAQTIDCAVKAGNSSAATLAEIVNSINSIAPEIASPAADGKHLILTSRNTGPTAKIELEPFSDGDASRALFGDIPLESSGSSAGPAVIIGEKSLLSSVDLRRRSLLRIAVDGRREVDIDIAGAFPAKTSLEEIVTRINQVVPGLASATADDKLQLTSPGTGPESRLSLKALRVLELIEYPRVQTSATLSPSSLVKHNGSWFIVNDGVADSYAEIGITAPQGTVGPGIVNSGLEWFIHLFEVLERGETARLLLHPRLGLQAQVIGLDGQTRSIAGSQILVGPLGAQTWIPFENKWSLSDARPLQLNNPQGSSIVLLKGLKPGHEVQVAVRESDLSSIALPALEADGKTHQLVGRLKTYHNGFRLVDANKTVVAELLAGRDTNLRGYLDQVVKVEGPLHSGSPPQMLVEEIVNLFDVSLYSVGPSGVAEDESYPGVVLGTGLEDRASLVRQINGRSEKAQVSKLVRGEELDKALILNIPLGKTTFRYLDCVGSRFDTARFNEDSFAGGCFNTHSPEPPVPCCIERGIFDVSRFNNAPPENIGAVFCSEDPFSEPHVMIDFRWEKFSAGSFIVNLPADLPARFGARFDDARFGEDPKEPETYAGAVAEPEDDPNFLLKLMSPASGKESNFVRAKLADTFELGWTPVPMPFRQPQFLTLGGPGRAARLYLQEEGLSGFIRLDAKEEGAWGNEISVAARKVGPAIYDVSIFYRGGRFEQARSIVLGAVKETVQKLLEPGPIGVLQAKAAGVRADVVRERADNNQLTVTT